jgi:hypothetical protein
MSDIPRYRPVANDRYGITDDADGKLCEYRDYARLKAEVEELKSQPDPLTAYLYADTLRRDDIKTLKAHIERLTKAGDAMADMVDWEVPYERRKKLEAEWNAAKEGNGQP